MTAESCWRVVLVPSGQRGAYTELMRLADDSPAQIEGYRDRGELYGLVSADGSPVGLVLAVPTESPRQIELVSVAIAEQHQGRGLGRTLVTEVLDRLRRSGAQRVRVATATSSLDAIGFYLRLGFRMWRVERDYFGPARGYPADLEEDGIPVRDRVWLDRSLEP